MIPSQPRAQRRPKLLYLHHPNNSASWDLHSFKIAIWTIHLTPTLPTTTAQMEIFIELRHYLVPCPLLLLSLSKQLPKKSSCLWSSATSFSTPGLPAILQSDSN